MNRFVRIEDVIDILNATGAERSIPAIEALPEWPEGRKGDYVMWRVCPGKTDPLRIQSVYIDGGVRYDFGDFSVSHTHGCIERIVHQDEPEAAEFKRQNVGGAR